MSVLIVGGSSGLGLELGKQFAGQGAKVIVTGRTDPKVDEAKFIKFDLSEPDLPQRLEKLVKDLPTVDIFVYAAGYYQEGRVTDLSEEQIEEMIDVGGRGLIYGVRALLKRQGDLPELITITSTSQWTPRRLEPIYNFAKAGAGHFTNAMAEDGRVAKALVAGPAGMSTAFWKHDPGRDMSGMLGPKWVAGQIMKARKQDYRYKYIRILREPPRVEEVEIR